MRLSYGYSLPESRELTTYSGFRTSIWTAPAFGDFCYSRGRPPGGRVQIGLTLDMASIFQPFVPSATRTRYTGLSRWGVAPGGGVGAPTGGVQVMVRLTSA